MKTERMGGRNWTKVSREIVPDSGALWVSFDHDNGLIFLRRSDTVVFFDLEEMDNIANAAEVDPPIVPPIDVIFLNPDDRPVN